MYHSEKVSVDFDIPAITAFQKLWLLPMTDCLFPLSESVIRKVQEFGVNCK